MFSKIQQYVMQASKGPLQLKDTTLFDINDSETLWAQLLNIVEQVEQQIPEYTQEVIQGEALEEQQEEEFNEDELLQGGEELEEFEEFEDEEEEEQENQDMNLITADEEELKNIEMQLQMEHSESSSQINNEPELPLTDYQKQKQQLQKLINTYEQDLIQKKSWKMSGEAVATDRAEGELLNELPEFQMKAKPKLEVTEELNQLMETIIKQRVLDKNYDNVVYELKEEEEEIKDVSTDKAKEGLGKQLQETTGLRTEVGPLVVKKRNEIKEQMADLETELRSYFVGGVWGK
ncbi:U3_small nucleolar ribonucleoprotein MPP10 [Hexamita inflata]|uniref:U3 small nucleolar ribonucleoprotein MPP10 n=1 Tax=Hexamita inflata TaxID=28002 RepID=A0AA86P277_9EUKA|nr:U3 small nucleolar ribonucleoprotein MPP10 [Hexamita inflata]